MAIPDKCPVCLQKKFEAKDSGSGKDTYHVKCAYCGEYEISRTLSILIVNSFEEYGSRHLCSSIVRNRTNSGLKTKIHTANIKELQESSFTPENPNESIDHLINIIGRYTKRPGREYRIDLGIDYPLFYASDYNEAKFYFDSAINLGFVEPPRESGGGYHLTLSGWMYFQEIISGSENNNKAFVAMWFDPKTDDAWQNGFLPALQACNYQAIRIDKEEHNEKICDRIVAEIRKCGLLVADFTGHRGGVYFEAGFAMGLGKSVIWTCHEGDMNCLHFDTRQYNHIEWSDHKDLKKKLINRINATINT